MSSENQPDNNQQSVRIEANIGDSAANITIGKDISSINMGDVSKGIHDSNIAGQDVHIHGDQVGGDKFTGDKIAGDRYNTHVTFVIQVLHIAQIADILAAIKGNVNFASTVETIESILNNQLKDELADAVGWVNEMLGGLLNEWLPQDNHSPISLTDKLDTLIKHIGVSMQNNGYWEAKHIRLRKQSTSFVHLAVTTMLFYKQYRRPLGQFYIECTHRHDYRLVSYFYILEPPVLTIETLRRYNSAELRTLIAGLILDLIRIKSDNAISVQFLKELADMVKPDSSKSQVASE